MRHNGCWQPTTQNNMPGFHQNWQHLRANCTCRSKKSIHDDSLLSESQLSLAQLVTFICWAREYPLFCCNSESGGMAEHTQTHWGLMCSLELGKTGSLHNHLKLVAWLWMGTTTLPQRLWRLMSHALPEAGGAIISMLPQVFGFLVRLKNFFYSKLVLYYMTSWTCTRLCLGEFYKFLSSTMYFMLSMHLHLTMHYFFCYFWNWMIQTLSSPACGSDGSRPPVDRSSPSWACQVCWAHCPLHETDSFSSLLQP